MNNPRSQDPTEDVRKRTAETLESAADSVRAAGHEGADALKNFATDAGGRLDSTADYVRTFAGGDVLGNLRHKVRGNPVGSLAVASAIGLVAGICWRGSCRRAHVAG
jgi:ElaB/YqjD/DUF883 family membrane-anchored ribosome-binding protein